MKLLKSAVFATSLLVTTFAYATPSVEVLLGIDLQPKTLDLRVFSGGCTDEDSFKIHVDKGFTGLPPYEVTVIRVTPDFCNAYFPEGVIVKYSREALGLDPNVEFYIKNKIANPAVFE